MTKEHIYNRGPPPVCVCGSVLTIKHIFLHCPQYQQQRQEHLRNKSIQSIFNDLNPSCIIDFLKSCSLYTKI